MNSFLDSEYVLQNVGELQLSYFVRHLMVEYQNSENIGGVNFEVDSVRREIDIAVNLLSFLDDFVADKVSVEDFTTTCNLQAQDVAKSAFGKIFLTMIGSAMTFESSIYLDCPLAPLNLSCFPIVRQTVADVRLVARTVQVGHKLLSHLDSMHKWEPRVSDVDPQMRPDLVDMMWAYVERDVAHTLARACQRLFYDDVGTETGHRRAEGVKLIGAAMLDAEKGAAVVSTSMTLRRLKDAFRLATNIFRENIP